MVMSSVSVITTLEPAAALIFATSASCAGFSSGFSITGAGGKARPRDAVAVLAAVGERAVGVEVELPVIDGAALHLDDAVVHIADLDGAVLIRRQRAALDGAVLIEDGVHGDDRARALHTGTYSRPS